MDKVKPLPVYPFQLPDLVTEEDQTAEVAPMDVLADVSIELEVELGRTQQRIGKVLEWEEGTVITLDKLAGESAEIFLNGSVIARGEIMVVDGKFGVRVVEISALEERIGDLV